MEMPKNQKNKSTVFAQIFCAIHICTNPLHSHFLKQYSGREKYLEELQEEFRYEQNFYPFIASRLSFIKTHLQIYSVFLSSQLTIIPWLIIQISAHSWCFLKVFPCVVSQQNYNIRNCWQFAIFPSMVTSNTSQQMLLISSGQASLLLGLQGNTGDGLMNSVKVNEFRKVILQKNRNGAGV